MNSCKGSPAQRTTQFIHVSRKFNHFHIFLSTKPPAYADDISPVTLDGFGQVPTPRCPGKHTLYQYFVPEDGHLRLGWWC